MFAKKLQSCAVPIGYCFPVLLWCCQCSLNLLIAFHQSGPEPQNACSALPRRQGSDSLFFLQDVSLTGSRNTDPAARCWGSLTAGSMRGWIFSTGSNIFNIFSLSLNWIHSESVMILFTRQHRNSPQHFLKQPRFTIAHVNLADLYSVLH